MSGVAPAHPFVDDNSDMGRIPNPPIVTVAATPALPPRGLQIRPGSRPPKAAFPTGPVTPEDAKEQFQQAMKAQTPEGDKLRHALEDIKKTGGTKEEKELVQNALINAGYHIGQFGTKRNGVDGVIGGLTSKALQAATGDTAFVDQTTPAYHAQHHQAPLQGQMVNQVHTAPQRHTARGPEAHH
jgi:hypothetical protein